MNRLFKDPKGSVQKGYSPFDLSHNVHFTSTTGELIPVMSTFLLPNDKVRLSSTLKTRTMELESNAMTSIKENIDYFFVPITQLLHSFDSQIYSIQDLNTDFFFNGQDYEPSVKANFPVFDLSEILGYMTDYFKFETDLDQLYSAKELLYDNFGFPKPLMIYRLLHYLGYGVKSILKSAVAAADPGTVFSKIPYFNLFKLLAYQKIYYDYYRDTNREVNNARAYNIDSYSGGSDNYKRFLIDDINSWLEIFTLRYRQWAKDPETNIQVSPLFSPDEISSLDSNFYDKLTNILSSQQMIGSPNDMQTLRVAGDENLVTSADIRNVFAAEKYGEITRRVAKHYQDLTKARFGVNVPNGLSGECFFLGHDESFIDTFDVVSTAATSDAPLGEIAGKGFGLNKGENVDFTAPCHGILMAIYSAAPTAYYSGDFVDKINYYEKSTDIYTPELDNLGMTPRYLFERQAVSDLSNWNLLLGWQYNYSELKQMKNVNYGAFQDSLNYWTTERDIKITYGSPGFGQPYDVYPLNGYRINPYMYKVSPYELDPIMLVHFKWFLLEQNDNHALESDVPLDTVFDRDPLFHELQIDFKKLSKMSVYSLPSL